MSRRRDDIPGSTSVSRLCRTVYPDALKSDTETADCGIRDPAAKSSCRIALTNHHGRRLHSTMPSSSQCPTSGSSCHRSQTWTETLGPKCSMLCGLGTTACAAGRHDSVTQRFYGTVLILLQTAINAALRTARHDEDRPTSCSHCRNDLACSSNYQSNTTHGGCMPVLIVSAVTGTKDDAGDRHCCEEGTGELSCSASIPD
ncbi:hypothetical protein VTN31DRAFT_5049 [Thermomyces dupontii]|uniref:uncharacterized protein n=1 Tax=Talaromyces thermophilus TaxID=28565 RepID=UPI00374382C2